LEISATVEFFRVVFELVEPVLVNRSVSFDGLLAHLLYRRTGDAGTANVSLPLAQIDGIYQASELLFLGPVVRRPIHYVMNLRWDRFDYGDLADGRGNPRRKTVARDVLKPTLDRYDAVSARRAFVLGLGEVDEVEALLADLDAVGKKSRSREFGRLASVRLDRIDDAPAAIGYTDFEGRPARVVPKSIWDGLELPSEDISFGPARPRLPRWATEDELCALPASHVILETGRSTFILDGIVLGEGTLVVVNEPGTTTTIDSVWIRRARRAMEVLGSVKRVKEARKLLDDRVEAVGDTDAIDRKIEALIRAVKVDNETFFDALDLLDGATPMELSLARQTP